MGWAMGMSALLHAAALAFLAQLSAREARRAPAAASAEPLLQEVVLVPEILAQAPRIERFIEAVGDGSPPAQEAAPFISDRNSRAASEAAPDPDGPAALPSQEGLDIPVIEVARQQLVEGDGEQSLAQGPPEPPSPSSSPAAAEPSAAPAAEDTPPAPPEEIATAPGGGMRLPEPSPRTSPPADTRTALREPEVEPQARSPAPPADAAPAFQAQKEKTRLRGSITRRGEASVDAADTPVGRYIRQVTSAVEKEWHRKRRQHADFVTYGTIRLEFYVTPEGRVEDLTIKNRDGANAIMQDFTLSAVLDARIPPMPAGLPALSGRDRLLITYDIIVY